MKVFNNVYEELYAAKNSMFSFFQNQELNGAISGTNDESSYKSKYNTEGYLFRGMYDYDGKYFFPTFFTGAMPLPAFTRIIAGVISTLWELLGFLPKKNGWMTLNGSIY